MHLSIVSHVNFEMQVECIDKRDSYEMKRTGGVVVKAILGSIFCVLVGLTANAKVFEYHENSPLALGLGVNFANPFEPQRECMDFEKELLDSEVARKSEISLRVVESKKELLRELGMSSSVAAQSYFVSGNAGVNYLEETSFQEDSLVWLVVGSVDFGRQRLTKGKLKPFAAKLLEDGQHDAFVATCGMQYVSQERRGASVFALYTLKNLTSRQKTDIKAHLNFKTSNVPFVNVESENKFSLAISEFARKKQLSFRLIAIGGSGITALSDVPKNEDNIAAIKEIVGSYLAGFTVGNAVPVEFLTSGFEQFGWVPSASLNWNGRDTSLSEYYFLAASVDAERKRLRNIVETHRDNNLEVSAEDVERYRGLLRERDAIYARLRSEAQACIADAGKCQIPNTDLPYIIWPRPSSPEKAAAINKNGQIWKLHAPSLVIAVDPDMSLGECEEERKAALASGCIRHEELAELVEINAAPLCTTDGRVATLGYCQN